MKSKQLKKKGFLDNALPFIFILVVASIGFFFMSLIGANKDQQKNYDISKQKYEVLAHEASIEYLNSISSKPRSELISEAAVNNENSQLQQDMKIFFDKKLGHYEGYRIEFTDSLGTMIFSFDGGIIGYSETSEKFLSDTILIPINSEKPDYTMLRIYIGKGESLNIIR